MADQRFKIVTPEPGLAHVVDRSTNKKLGHLLANYWMEWQAFCSDEPGVSLGWARLRTVAAETVWRHHQEVHP